MSARDFKGYGGYGSWSREKLDGLSYIQCVGLVIRRGMASIGHLGDIVRDAGSVSLSQIVAAGNMEHSIFNDDGSPLYVDTSDLSEKLINILCLYWFINCACIVAGAILAVAGSIVQTGLLGALSILGQGIACGVSILMWTVLMAGIVWVYSLFYHRWQMLACYVYLLANVVILLINTIGLGTGIGGLIGALSLKWGLLYLLNCVISVTLKAAGTFLSYYQAANMFRKLAY